MQTRRQEKVGVVTSNKMQKTVVVTVVRQVTHPLYKRVVRRSKRFMAHDEKNECRVGDTVRIQETRPLSSRKRWRVVEILTKAALVAPVPEVDV
ncbi:MAG: 30S ribosomal protein S17 [Terriglobia bacterium]|jgi:small subunit ribosomal protein S17